MLPQNAASQPHPLLDQGKPARQVARAFHKYKHSCRKETTVSFDVTSVFRLLPSYHNLHDRRYQGRAFFKHGRRQEATVALS